MHNYISRVGYNLHEAIRNRDAELIRSYRRALHLGIACTHETTNREAGARGWDPAAVDCMMREVEESTETLLPEAEQVLMELEEEARANWEERAIHQATQVTNLAGEGFETLSENRWSRRDCMEYQEELDWAMRTFRRICGEVDTASMPAKMRRMAARGLTESTVSTSGPRGSWRDSYRHMEDGRRSSVRRPEVVTERSRSIGTTSASDAPPIQGWSVKIPSRWSGSQPCR
jgi:hypothetical protein